MSKELLEFSSRAHAEKIKGSGEKQTKAIHLCANGLGLALAVRKAWQKLLLKQGKLWAARAGAVVSHCNKRSPDLYPLNAVQITPITHLKSTFGFPHCYLLLVLLQPCVLLSTKDTERSFITFSNGLGSEMKPLSWARQVHVALGGCELRS